jgi:hypothetical protein
VPVAMGMVRRQQLWEMKYQERPYLMDVSDADLADRFNYIFQNITLLTAEQKIGFQQNKEDAIYWMALMTHMFVEYNRRGGIPAGIARREIMPFPFSNASLKFPDKPFVPGKSLVKYSKKQFLEEMLYRGKIRLSPASSFSGSGNNYATYDDEFSRTTVRLKSEIKMSYANKETGQKEDIELLGNSHFTVNFKTDYYMYCMSRSYEMRFFQDFRSDACLVIHDPEEFKKRVLQTTGAQFKEWVDMDESVNYIDPYNVGKIDEILVPFTKHHRYWYQREYRFCWFPPLDWLPPPSKASLMPLYLEIGPLTDIAELIAI